MRARHWYSSALLPLLLASVAAADCPQVLSNNEFTNGLLTPWVVEAPGGYADVTYKISTDSYHALIMTVYADLVAPEPSDAALSQSIALVAGQQYKLTFWARGEAHDGSDVPVTVKVGKATSPYTQYGLLEDILLTYNAGSGDNYSFTFTASTTDPSAGLVFMFGLLDADITFDSIFLEQVSSPSCTNGTAGSSGVGNVGTAGGSSVATGGAGTGGAGTGGTPTATGGSTGITGALIRANQAGYVRQAEKVATVKHPSTSAIDWQLLDGSSTVLATGATRSMGLDPISGDYVHLADFSDYATTGASLRLRVGNATSQEFRIGGDVFGALRRDAIRFYYFQRASTAITQSNAENPQWARAGGHADTSVPCRAGTGCSYSLNVSKGWYDAGDFGKYVVNGGISAWTLMHMYERTLHLGNSLPKLGDGTLNIPESSNSIPDVLDEVRWEMEFLLGMQVPAGQTLAGMAHHKVHGTSWPAIPMAPANDLTGRVLSAPSTAATLNLAATAAQAARIFAPLDATFATKCRAAAESAYAAAEANPAIYAVNTPNGGGDDDGGGAYDDADVTDEFYWAAAELFTTTGATKYLTALTGSPHHLKISAVGAPMNWSSTAAAGALTLAVVPSGISSTVLSDVRHAVVNAADAYRAIATTAYGTPIQSYFWGSNSDVLNSGIVLAVAYDLTGLAAYRAAALGSLDYVLGRNPLGKSYVTGYGTSPFVNAHHRFFAHGFNSSWPTPPPGVVAGGPNQNLDGLTTPGSLAGCQGPKCWTDVAAAYGLTEITVNWNAPLAWMAAWASEQELSPKAVFPGYGDGNSGAGGANAGGASGSLNQAGAAQAGTAQAGAATLLAGGASASGGVSSGGTSVVAAAGQPIAAQAGGVNVIGQGGNATWTAAGSSNAVVVSSAGSGNVSDPSILGGNGNGGNSTNGGKDATGLGGKATLNGGGNAAVATQKGDDPECDCRVPTSRGSNRAWLAALLLGLMARRKRRG